MGCIKITLLIVFAIVQILVLALSIVAIALPQWLDPEKRVFTTVDGVIEEVDNVGLWQLCVVPIGTNETRGTIDSTSNIGQQIEDRSDSFSQIGSDECKTGNIVEDFYRGKPVEELSIFGENVYSEFMATRALAILFVIFAFVKFFMVLAAKCREEGGWCTLVIAVVIALLEAGFAAGTLIAYGLILDKGVDQENALNPDVDVGIREFWGLSYQMFLSASVIAVVADLAFCICC